MIKARQGRTASYSDPETAMKHAIIFAHPRKESFTASVADAYAGAVRALGQEAVVRDLYGMGFDPCLKASEIPGEDGYRAGPDVIAERRAIEGANVFVLVYPFWFNSLPAILKGYVDRVFSADFGYELMPGGAVPLLEGRRLISFTSSGAPDQWVQSTGALETLKKHFDTYLASMCGLTLVDHLHFGGVSPSVTTEWVDRMLADVRTAAQRVAQAELAVT
jgi:NAD(P)H dehydrogenase (quinone)